MFLLFKSIVSNFKYSISTPKATSPLLGSIASAEIILNLSSCGMFSFFWSKIVQDKSYEKIDQINIQIKF